MKPRQEIQKISAIIITIYHVSVQVLDVHIHLYHFHAMNDEEYDNTTLQ